MEVGIRELRADLSRYVKRVRSGEEIVITDRGKAVARIVPAGESNFDRLVREGVIIPAPNGGRPRKLLPPIEGVGPLSDLVDSGRD